MNDNELYDELLDYISGMQLQALMQQKQAQAPQPDPEAAQVPQNLLGPN